MNNERFLMQELNLTRLKHRVAEIKYEIHDLTESSLPIAEMELAQMEEDVFRSRVQKEAS